MKKTLITLFLSGNLFCYSQVGNVGINTTTPQKTLHVNGSLQITSELNVGGSSTTPGSAGTAGQSLISNGSNAAPSWSSGFVPQVVASASLSTPYPMNDGDGYKVAQLGVANFNDGNYSTSGYFYNVTSAGTYNLSLNAGITFFNNNANNTMSMFLTRENSSGLVLQRIFIGLIKNLSYAGTTSEVTYFAGSSVVRASVGEKLYFQLQPCNGCVGSYQVSSLDSVIQKVSN